MNIEEVLKQFGLDAKEIKVYLALLQLGKAAVQPIAKKAQVKRPTTYLILDSLLQKGLISKVPLKNKTLFSAANPEKIVDILEKRKKEVKKIIPELLSIYNFKPDKPQIQLFEGRDGVTQVHKEIMKSKEAWWYGNLLKFYENFRETFDEFEDLIINKKIKFRDFAGNSDWEKEYAASSQSDNHEVRISPLPADIDFFIFNDKVAINSMDPDYLYAVVIQDKRIADSLKNLYELAWRQAGKFKPSSKAN